MVIKVNDGVSAAAIEIQQILANDAGIMALAKDLNMNSDLLAGILKGSEFVEGKTYSLGDLLEQAVDKVPGDQQGVADLLAKAQLLEGEVDASKGNISELEERIKELEANQHPSDADKAELKEKKATLLAIKKLEGELKEAKSRLETAVKNADNKKFTLSEDLKKQVNTFLGKQADAKAQEAASGSDSSSVTPVGYKSMMEGNTGTGATNSQASAGKALTGSSSPYADILNSGKASGVTIGADLDTGMGDLLDIQAEQQKRQHMMTLFFYYARMAMSGDVGAMYQFMRFIGYVISRDKALQNVWMGTKLIELQETSRKATEKLLNYKVGESAAEQADWQKELQKVKSEEGIVATSQKLITQMMEEFTQVVETLTNVQKSLLDVNGKILSNLSVWR